MRLCHPPLRAGNLMIRGIKLAGSSICPNPSLSPSSRTWQSLPESSRVKYAAKLNQIPPLNLINYTCYQRMSSSSSDLIRIQLLLLPCASRANKSDPFQPNPLSVAGTRSVKATEARLNWARIGWYLHLPPPPTPTRHFCFIPAKSRLRTVTSLPRLTSRTKNIAPSLYTHQIITKQTYLANPRFYPPYVVIFYFALYIIVLIRYPTTVLYLPIRLLLATSVKQNVIVIVIFKELLFAAFAYTVATL